MENWTLIQRYITGNATPTERRELWKWMEQDPTNRELVRQLEEIWEQTPEEELQINTEEAWRQFCSETVQGERVQPVVYNVRRNKKSVVNYFRAAAVILVIILSGYLANNYLVNTQNEAEQAQEFYVMQDLVTNKGEKASVTFSDGTKVILNAASSLRFPKEFTGEKREVFLDGEAYFKVSHNPNNPFIVHAQNTDIKVLGTEFNVQGWEEDDNVDVSVRSGKVAVNSKTDQQSSEVILTKGEFTRVDKQQGPAKVQKVNIENHLLWTRGGMNFDNVPLEQVFRHLERKFDISIAIADTSLLQVPYHSTFDKANMEEILHVIATSMKLEYQKKSSRIVFK